MRRATEPFWKPHFSQAGTCLGILVVVACFTQDIKPLGPGSVQSPTLLVPELAPPKAVEAADTTPSKPQHLRIQSVGIDASIDPVGILPDGKMDVPSNGQLLGWFEGGPKPGEKGSAVIAGHLNTIHGPGAFWRLQHAQIGDTIETIDIEGQTHLFRIREMNLYDADYANMEHIFRSNDGSHLNLITCAGQWSVRLNHYDKRLVVFADQISHL